MNLYHSTDIDGISELNPDETRMRELIAQLDNLEYADSEHPDVSLIHDNSGWALTIYASGIVTFENLDDPDDCPRFLSKVSRDAAFELWRALARGGFEYLNARPWRRDED